MKTHKNSKKSTREGHLSKSELERGVPTNNKRRKYEATLFWMQHNQATVIIEAKSLAEAEKKADAIESDEIDDWSPCDGEIWVDSVEPVEGGKTNE